MLAWEEGEDDVGKAKLGEGEEERDSHCYSVAVEVVEDGEQDVPFQEVAFVDEVHHCVDDAKVDAALKHQRLEAHELRFRQHRLVVVRVSHVQQRRLHSPLLSLRLL